MEQVQKLIELGKSCGLKDSDLLEFVEKKEKEIYEREQRALERDERKSQKEKESNAQQVVYEQQKLDLEFKLKAELLDKEIQLEQLRAASGHVGSGASDQSSNPKRPKLPFFEESRDNIDSYLQRFERFAESANWKHEHWAINLSALLKGRSLEVYSRLSPEDAGNYDKLKEALLRRFQLTEEGFRVKFRNCKPETGETFAQYIVRLDNYLTRWIDMSGTEHAYDNLRDLLLREQFINASHKNLALFLKERKPGDVKTMATLADQYMEAHKGVDVSSMPTGLGTSKSSQSSNRTSQNDKSVRTCYACHEKGHIAKDCPKSVNSAKKVAALVETNDTTYQNYEEQNSYGSYGRGNNFGRGRGYFGRGRYMRRRFGNNFRRGGFDSSETEPKTVTETAALCVEQGLLECCASDSKVKLECGHELPVLSVACSDSSSSVGCNNQLPVVEGLIGNQRVKVLRDTGCSGVVVREDLVKDCELSGKMQMCVLMDGTVRKVPLVTIDIDTPYCSGTVEALCFKNPVYDLVIGNVDGAREPNNPDLSWTAKHSTCLETIEEDPEGEYNETGSEGVMVNAVQTRGQLKAERQKIPSLNVRSAIDLDINIQDLQNAQREDETLNLIRELVSSGEKRRRGNGNTVWYVEFKGLIYRYFESGKNRQPTVKQLVIPKQYRTSVMVLAHESILAGHLGVKKTSDRILTQFFWPGMQGDIKRFCLSCDSCQRTYPKGKVAKVPLQPMPIIEQPFKRVAVDIIGPMHPITDRKNRYVLTLVDYATRYPEAIALPKIDSECVAEALVEMFSRVGIPEEILTDQGSQFTGDFMKEVSRLLSVKQMVTTPYHPMCNGLVERFNGTLKSMLRKMCIERPKDWDRYLPALLFAYRETPQASLGFAPFELLYGRTVRGPMCILKQLWTKEIESPEVKTTYQYVLDLRNRMEETCELAMKELGKHQSKYKKHFDKKTKDRTFEPGDRVLILLPTDENKLLMRWKGPYVVLERIGLCDYKIQLPRKVKVFHANMLKKYWEKGQPGNSETLGLLSVACAAVVLETESTDTQTEPKETHTDDGSDEKPNDSYFDKVPVQLPCTKAKETTRDLKISSDLTTTEVNDVQKLISEYQNVFTDLPGKCELVTHSLRLTTETPVRSKPYPVPYAVRDTVRDEVDAMLRMGIIQPSESPYSSPVVLVKKPDGSNRFCVDFRRLNSITVFDAEPMPDPEEIFSKLSKCKYFSKIDLSKGYWQIPLDIETRPLTAFITPDGLFEFLVMPFGLVNAPATFNRMMRKLLQGLQCISSFLDDILIYTEAWEEHVEVLRKLMERLECAKLTARPSKCMIGFGRLDFLGHFIGEGEVRPHTNKIEKIERAPRPTTKKQVRSFLGLIGYYRKFVPNFAAISSPLSDLTKKGQPNDVIWGPEQEQAFCSLKAHLTREPILHLPDCNLPFVLRTDASNVGLGAVLMQEHGNEIFPVSYASKKLLTRQKSYSTIEKEALAVIWAVQKFHAYLYGRDFVLQTDHQPLLYMNRCKFSNSRIMRWALILQDYRFRIVSIKGKDNVGADYLSRAFSEA